MPKKSGLELLESRVWHDLSIIGYPINEWIPEKFDDSGDRILDVLIVGAGQGGIVDWIDRVRDTRQ